MSYNDLARGFRAITIGAALLGAAEVSQAAFVDFEPPTYTANVTVAGQDGWQSGFASPNSKITPAIETSVVLAGAQSLAVTHTGLYRKAVNLPAGPLPEEITVSYLHRVDADPSGTRYGSFYLSHNFTTAATPMGVEAYAYNGGNPGFFTLFGLPYPVPSAVPVIAGKTYLVEMVLDFGTPTPTFEGFATNLTDAGPRLSLGTRSSFATLTAADIFQNTNGGLYVGNGDASIAFFDDITIVIPEPASVGLLAAGAVVVLGRRRVTRVG
jgi:hypothetical protein